MRRLGILVLFLWLTLATLAVAATNTNLRGTTDTLITNSTNIANNAGFITAAAVTLTSTGYMFADCEFNGPAWSGTPAANSGITVWLCREVDGTNYESCDTTNFSPRLPDVFFPLTAVSGAQRITRQVVLPPGNFKVLMRNDSTGVSLNGATTAWTIKCKPWTIQTQ